MTTKKTIEVPITELEVLLRVVKAANQQSMLKSSTVLLWNALEEWRNHCPVLNSSELSAFLSAASSSSVSPVETTVAKQTWYGYECQCGVVLDIRLDGKPEPPIVLCPQVHSSRQMKFKGRWLADEDGYGSRGDSGSELARKALEVANDKEENQ